MGYSSCCKGKALPRQSCRGSSRAAPFASMREKQGRHKREDSNLPAESPPPWAQLKEQQQANPSSGPVLKGASPLTSRGGLAGRGCVCVELVPFRLDSVGQPFYRLSSNSYAIRRLLNCGGSLAGAKQTQWQLQPGSLGWACCSHDLVLNNGCCQVDSGEAPMLGWRPVRSCTLESPDPQPVLHRHP